MSQADELINGLSDEEFALYTANPTEEQHIIVDENRIITVPSELKKIAVQYDHNIETVTFDCIRYWDGHDMSTMKVYINYTRSDKYTGCYLADNVRVDEADGSIMHFDWTISRNVTESVGPLTILVCIKMVDADGNEVNHWNSERNTDMTISQGMECGDIIANKYPDVITYLLNMRFPVNYLESLDSENMVNLRDLDSGTYILKGKFRPFEGSTHIYTFSSGMLLSIIKQETTSYVQIFYSRDNTIQYLEIGDSSVTRKDAKLINMESIANKVTDINEGSDDYHYPSAKAVYNAITTTSITTSTATNLTGLLKGNGTSIEAAEANVDYQSPLIAGVDYASPEQVNDIKNRYQSKTIIDSDGYFENKTVEGALAELAAKSSTSITTSTATNLTGLLKGNGTSVVAATAGTDYATPDDAKAFVVTFTENTGDLQGTYTPDKTLAEIYAAYNANKNIIGRFASGDPSVMTLITVYDASSMEMGYIYSGGVIKLYSDSNNNWFMDEHLFAHPAQVTEFLPESGHPLSSNIIYDISSPVGTYVFTSQESGWAHGTFTTGTAPNITFTGKIIGKLPTFAASKQYEFDVYNGAWIVQEVLTQ